MKIHIILSVISLVICSLSFAQEDFEVDYNPVNKLKLYYDDYYIEFEFAIEEKIEVEIREGLFYYWYKENQINRTQGGFDGKLLYGTFTVFYRNGKLKEKGNFKYGLKDEKWKKWYENGNLLQTSNWESGQLTGKWIEYDENGLITKEANYKEGKLNGDYKEFIDGELVLKKKYKNGKEIRVKSFDQEDDSNKEKNTVEDNQTQHKDKQE
ncbi:MAG: hypothetical protein K8R68_08920 [Bacteroidales bacterium]|nr:hypothetical protein [Bacteroidales bacterium]